jgi:hypothetical protein
MFNQRAIFLWKLYDSIAKEKRPTNFYFANLGGSIRSSVDLVRLGEVCEWFQCDNQGRGEDETPIGGCALQGRVCNAVQKGKMATNVTAACSTGTPRWRNVYKSQQEEQMWFDETLASGTVPYHHIIGGENGMGRTAAGWNLRASTSNGWRRTTPISSTSAPQRMWASSWASGLTCFTSLAALHSA